MTARSLPNLPVRNVLRVLKQNQKMSIVTCILQILGIPLIIGAFMWMAIAGSQPEGSRLHMYEESSILYIVIGFCCLGVAVFMGLFAAICSFTELHSKSKVDMLYALPLTGDQRFFSDYLGGVCMYIVPYVVSMILGWVVLLATCPFVNFGELGMTQSKFMGEAAKYYALASFGLLALMVLYYTLSVFVTVCCGTLFESIYTNILLNVLIPGTMAAVIAVICNRLDLSFEYIWNSIGYTSPVGGLIYLIFMLTSMEDLLSLDFGGYWDAFYATQTDSHALMPSYLRWIVVILVVAVLLTVAAWKLYTYRKSEYVGKPFVYLFAYYLMLTLLTTAILCLCEAGVVGPIILFAAIVYFIMEVIRKRGFKRFWISAVTFAVTVVLFFGGGALIVSTNGFGRVYYIPGTAAISSVRVELTDYRGNSDFSLEYTDKDVIRAVTEFHKGINDRLKQDMQAGDAINQSLTDQRMVGIQYHSDSGINNAYMPYYSLYSTIPEDVEVYDDDYDSYFGYDDDYEYEILEDAPVDTSEAVQEIEFPEGKVGDYVEYFRVSVTYYTVTGSSVHRSLLVNADELIELADIVHDTPLYAEALEKGFWNRLQQAYSEYNEKIHDSEIPDTVTLQMDIDYYRSSQSHYSKTISDAPKKLEQLTSVYRQDIENMTIEDFHTADIYGYLVRVPVYETCTETIALLEEWGVSPFSVPERFDFPDLERLNNENADADYQQPVGVRIYAPGTWTTASQKYPCSLADDAFVKQDAEGTPAYEDIYAFTRRKAMRVKFPELYQLLDTAQTRYITDEECYLVMLGDVQYVIPPEHSDLAEAVIAKGSFSALASVWSDSDF